MKYKGFEIIQYSYSYETSTYSGDTQTNHSTGYKIKGIDKQFGFLENAKRYININYTKKRKNINYTKKRKLVLKQIKSIKKDIKELDKKKDKLNNKLCRLEESLGR